MPDARRPDEGDGGSVEVFVVLDDGSAALEAMLVPEPFEDPFGRVPLTGLELADQKRSRLSRGELTPFSERGSTVLLEVLTTLLTSALGQKRT